MENHTTRVLEPCKAPVQHQFIIKHHSNQLIIADDGLTILHQVKHRGFRPLTESDAATVWRKGGGKGPRRRADGKGRMRRDGKRSNSEKVNESEVSQRCHKISQDIATFVAEISFFVLCCEGKAWSARSNWPHMMPSWR